MAETAPASEPETAANPILFTETSTPIDDADRPREMDLTGDTPEFVEVPIPYGASEYVCPACEQPIQTRKQINLAKPAKFAHRLNDVMKCPNCSFIFSYKLMSARVLRQ